MTPQCSSHDDLSPILADINRPLRGGTEPRVHVRRSFLLKPPLFFSCWSCRTNVWQIFLFPEYCCSSLFRRFVAFLNAPAAAQSISDQSLGHSWTTPVFVRYPAAMQRREPSGEDEESFFSFLLHKACSKLCFIVQNKLS